LKVWRAILLLWSLSLTGFSEAQQVIKGVVVEHDSTTVLPFVYIINKSNGNGTMSDNDGRFMLTSSPNDTLICSYVGFQKLYVPVSSLLKNEKGEVKLVMRQSAVQLAPVNITAFKIQPYERAYMNDIIERSVIRKLNYASSPFTSVYMRYSKEGKQIQKLARIFENILIEEEVQRRLSREILVRLTGDDKIDYYAFRRYCYYLNDQYIVTHEGAELYSRVMDCYKTWKADVGGFKKWEDDGNNTKKDPDANWRKREEVPPEED
jgi:hypothetical protein